MIKIVLGLFLFSLSTLFAQKTVNDFRLLNVDGKNYSLKNYPSAKGFIIIFTSNHCPFAKLYPPRLNALHTKYKKVNVPLIAISSTDTIQYAEDSYFKMKQKAKLEHFNFPYLYDASQAVAINFNAERTPHAFVIWKENNLWVIKYNGAIDDNGANPTKVEQRFIENAVDALLIGKEVALKETKSVGCEIHIRGKKSMKN